MTDASAEMPPPSDLSRLEQTIAELMARIAALQDGLDSPSIHPETAGDGHDARTHDKRAVPLPQATVRASAATEQPGDAEKLAALRNALKDLGAHMAVLTMRQEGANSPIPTLVREAGKIPQSSIQSGGVEKSIAQRIHALLAEGDRPPSAI